MSTTVVLNWGLSFIIMEVLQQVRANNLYSIIHVIAKKPGCMYDIQNIVCNVMCIQVNIMHDRRQQTGQKSNKTEIIYVYVWYSRDESSIRRLLIGLENAAGEISEHRDRNNGCCRFCCRLGYAWAGRRRLTGFLR